jgi:hypothetical protein
VGVAPVIDAEIDRHRDPDLLDDHNVRQAPRAGPENP